MTVVIPCFNSEKYIADTILSVLKQTFRDFELIIVDDGSNDRTADIVREFVLSDDRVLLFCQNENRGANYCRNFGLNRAKGDYVIFLDADDLLLPFCLDSRYGVFQSDTRTDYVIFPMGLFKKEIGDDRRRWVPDTRNPLRDFLTHDLPWQTMQVIWKRDCIMELGGFDVNFERLQDVELHTRALLQPELKFKQMVGEPDCYYRIDPERRSGSLSLFLKKWIESTNKYCLKFRSLIPEDSKNYLWGTIAHSYLQILHHFRLGEISEKEFCELENKLISQLYSSEVNAKQVRILVFLKRYNLHFFRVPGVNWYLRRLLVS